MNKNEIKEKYINAFFPNLTDKDKKEIYFKDYMWHAFSYNKVSHLEKKAAVKAFNKRRKNDVYIFFQRDKKILEFKNLTYKKLLNKMKKEKLESDCYIVDKNFEWTFVFTHEAIQPTHYWWQFPKHFFYIGPFFKSISN